MTKKQTQLFRAMLDTLPDMIALKDTDLTYEACNKAFCNLIGAPEGEIIGKTDIDLFPPEDAEYYQRQDQQVLETGRLISSERLVHTPRWTYWEEMVKWPFRDDAGEIAGILQTSRDVTERKQKETLLSQDRSLLRSLLDDVPDYIYFKDTECRFIRISRALARFMGIDSPEEAVGKSDFDLMPADHARKSYDDEQRVIRTGEPMLNAVEKIVSENGQVFWHRSTKARLVDEDGRTMGLVGISRDITREKELEEKADRERLQQQVIEAQKRAIQELSTPIIPVMDQIIIMPLIGGIDTLRAREIMRVLLAGINEHRARVVILDITGVPIIDSGVASHLNKTIQAARLKGTHTIVTGISDAVAETVVELGLDWSGIETLDSLQTGLLVALSRLGRKLV